MSLAADESKLAARVCHICRDRREFRHAREVRAARQHVVCFDCYRLERDRRGAQLPLDLEAIPFLRSTPAGDSTLSEGARAHRARMLAHLDRTRRGAAGGHQ